MKQSLTVIILYVLAALGVLLFFISCNTEKEILSKAAKHPQAVAAACAQLFPIKENITVRVDTVTQTVKLPAEYVIVNCDSAEHHRTDSTTTMYVRVPCPPQEVITKLVTKDSIVREENTARITSLEYQINNSKAEAIRLQHGRNLWRKFAIILMAYTAIRIILKFYLKKL